MDHMELALEVKFSPDDAGKTGTFEGYGAIFGNQDSYDDVIAPGAFKKTLQDWEKKSKFPKMLLQHGGGFLGGAEDQLPIGKWTSMEENSKGLKVSGQLFAMSTDRGALIYEGLKSGELDGLSIGYRAKEFVVGTKPGEPRRKLTAVELLEVSVVTFPANDKATIGRVKSSGIKSIREFEEFLRDVGGFSHAAAKAIANNGFKSSDPRDEDEKKLSAFLESLQEAQKAF